ncbi:hypothetical protein TorRG33x02_033590, partial [Trema orientale]
YVSFWVPILLGSYSTKLSCCFNSYCTYFGLRMAFRTHETLVSELKTKDTYSIEDGTLWMLSNVSTHHTVTNEKLATTKRKLAFPSWLWYSKTGSLSETHSKTEKTNLCGHKHNV